ncbi:hypothetical protein BU16DRAFT_142721 [Lophium mytilinum]|uniref:Nephrocystin 3-like N-terminal domain-containing protein n=1 Tax=Lophium mytilinum TaxID=390894 RepID=A0A6A6QF88_9PEZI|nr:hypothetical protein BU16DRAFT_142721 [Lophium mytilinum]
MAAPNPDQLDENRTAEEFLKQRRSAAQRVERIRAWLSAPDWKTSYQQTVRRRWDGTGRWFLADRRYQAWRTAQLRGKEPINVRGILAVEAKPGFGKTFLSSIIVDDLKAPEGPLHHVRPEKHAVAFFHFIGRNPDTHRSSMQAFRAVATQLLEAHQHDRDAMHHLAFWIEKESSGQQQPSFDDVVCVVRILVRHCPTFLVFDGVDECYDNELFLAAVYDLCSSEECKILLLGRPSMSFPQEYQNCGPPSNWRVVLSNHENFEDIGRFLHSGIESMESRGLFGEQIIDLAVTEEVTRRADGVFLWATLFEQFLNSAALAPQERYDTLHRQNHLRGLGALYNGILHTLTRRNEREKTITADIFRWLAHPIKPLTIPALHTALALIPGQPTTESQYLPNFPECVAEITGGLAGLDPYGTPVFTHRSVKEHLQSNQCVVFDFSLFDESAMHAHLASRCISYLAHDIPKQPLEASELQQLRGPSISSGASLRTVQTERSGDSGFYSQSSDEDVPMEIVTDKKDFETAFPLLRYAVLCWPVHLSRSLTLSPATAQNGQASQYAAHQPHNSFSTSAITESQLGWVSVLSQFLLDRLAVTAWVESSWRYRLPPNLSRLVPLMERLHASIALRKNETRELGWVILGVKELRDALNDLRSNHLASLSAKPSLIWERGALAKGSESYWPLWQPQANGQVVSR